MVLLLLLFSQAFVTQQKCQKMQIIFVDKISWNSNSYRALSSSNKIVFE